MNQLNKRNINQLNQSDLSNETYYLKEESKQKNFHKRNWQNFISKIIVFLLVFFTYIQFYIQIILIIKDFYIYLEILWLYFILLLIYLIYYRDKTQITLELRILFSLPGVVSLQEYLNHDIKFSFFDKMFFRNLLLNGFIIFYNMFLEQNALIQISTSWFYVQIYFRYRDISKNLDNQILQELIQENYKQTIDIIYPLADSLLWSQILQNAVNEQQEQKNIVFQACLYVIKNAFLVFTFIFIYKCYKSQFLSLTNLRFSDLKIFIIPKIKEYSYELNQQVQHTVFFQYQYHLLLADRLYQLIIFLVLTSQNNKIEYKFGFIFSISFNLFCLLNSFRSLKQQKFDFCHLTKKESSRYQIECLNKLIQLIRNLYNQQKF
ncbi:transmembrane protein, putative (macronuclear) [Tetrahymena thermophila SB210]|uniref:Transmembrane protein, putative n=1 Tax=Tetrahymena thermophila (strain SB210) TaxID=312017 RepID=W7XIJ2_TETTS|nr:transmembrane protein, putative [Tetrahymena thermophila SB210]EWS73329.1 transmembrane protein, putative [Tetrahymena thermophila SB210]|eukprot:XP_012654134.1 transmembrane protein, putative [Tetrahymena thermophila SB210]